MEAILETTLTHPRPAAPDDHLCHILKETLLKDLVQNFIQWHNLYLMPKTLAIKVTAGIVEVSTAQAMVTQWLDLHYVKTGVLHKLWREHYPCLRKVKVVTRNIARVPPKADPGIQLRPTTGRLRTGNRDSDYVRDRSTIPSPTRYTNLKEPVEPSINDRKVAMRLIIHAACRVTGTHVNSFRHESDKPSPAQKLALYMAAHFYPSDSPAELGRALRGLALPSTLNSGNVLAKRLEADDPAAVLLVERMRTELQARLKKAKHPLATQAESPDDCDDADEDEHNIL